MRLVATSLLTASLAACSGETLAHDPGTDIPYVSAAIDGPNGETGTVWLKLHDDKGDLELWLWNDHGRTPAALPLDTDPRVTFFGRGDGGSDVTLVLRPRDLATNPDEDGNDNITAGKTHYFIYPDGDQDSSWLSGTDFRADVKVALRLNNEPWETETFELVPHSHAGGSGHSHD